MPSYDVVLKHLREQRRTLAQELAQAEALAAATRDALRQYDEAIRHLEEQGGTPPPSGPTPEPTEAQDVTPARAIWQAAKASNGLSSAESLIRRAHARYPQLREDVLQHALEELAESGALETVSGFYDIPQQSLLRQPA